MPEAKQSRTVAKLSPEPSSNPLHLKPPNLKLLIKPPNLKLQCKPAR